MKLNTIDERHNLIETLIKKAFKLDEMWVKGEENYDDWVANMQILKNLVSIDDMIHTERIFLDTLNDMETVRARVPEDKEIFIDIVRENLRNFIDTLLLHILEFSFDDLKNWGFKSEVGKKFHKEVGKKFDALIKKYQDLYDL